MHCKNHRKKQKQKRQCGAPYVLHPAEHIQPYQALFRFLESICEMPDETPTLLLKVMSLLLVECRLAIKNHTMMLCSSCFAQCNKTKATLKKKKSCHSDIVRCNEWTMTAEGMMCKNETAMTKEKYCCCINSLTNWKSGERERERQREGESVYSLRKQNVSHPGANPIQT